MAAEAKNVENLRMAQALPLPGSGRTLEQAGQIMGVNRRTVIRLREAFRHGKQTGQRGGRRRELMSLEQEKAFLERWRKQAQAGELVVVGPMWTAPVRMSQRNWWCPKTSNCCACPRTRPNSWEGWMHQADARERKRLLGEILLAIA